MSRVIRVKAFRAVLFGFLFLMAIPAATQPVRLQLSGVVRDSTDGKPLPGAHVIIAESMIGDVTDRDGRYTLRDVPPGAHRIYASMVGYTSAGLNVFIRPGENTVFDLILSPSTIELGEVTVEAKEDRKWKDRLERFTEAFIGESPNAKETRILNPEVLDFGADLSTLTAHAPQPLMIENKALGYRVQYFLKDFKIQGSRTWYDGEPLYTEMTPESPEQAALWKENRRRAFYGSMRHLMLALLSNKIEEQGFALFNRPAFNTAGAPGRSSGGIASTRMPVKAESIVQFVPGAPDQRRIKFDGALEVIYIGEKEDGAYGDWMRKYGGMGETHRNKGQTSYLQLENGPALVDLKGDFLDPYAALQMGYYAFERVGDELPKEYRPTAE